MSTVKWLAAGVVIAMSASVAVQARQTPLPRVIAADVPQYPRDAAGSRASGIVAITVETDGHQISTAKVLQSVPVLGDAAIRNLRSWRFASHTPATFTTTFRYSIVERPCDSLGRDTHAAAVIRFPSEVDVFTERDGRCDDMTPLPPVFGIFIREAAIPFFPAAARTDGIEGTVRIGVTYKGVLSLADGPPELGNPLIEAIRDWQLVPGPYSEEMTFKFRLIDGDCKGGGPAVTVGPGLTSYEVTDKRPVACSGQRAEDRGQR